MHAVRVCAQMRAIKEALVADVAVQFVGAEMQPFMFQVARARKKELAANVT